MQLLRGLPFLRAHIGNDLGEVGASPKAAQALARHSTIGLPFGDYRVDRLDKVADDILPVNLSMSGSFGPRSFRYVLLPEFMK
jgi:hypothetical protein